MMSTSDSTKDYYTMLGVSPDATAEQIRTAYRRLAKKYHPDLNPNDAQATEHFKRLTEAYRTLNDNRLRLEYHEQFLAKTRAGFTQVRPTVIKAWQEYYKQGSRRKSAPRRGTDIEITVPVSLEEIASGGTRTIQILRQSGCRLCGGTGIKPGFGKVVCKVCDGIGDITVRKGDSIQFEICRNCNGEGTIVKDRCMNCAGTGRERSEHAVVLQIPAGLPTSEKVIYKGQGHLPVEATTPGDLQITFVEAQHPYFERIGTDLLYQHRITPEQFFAGGVAIIPTLTTPVSLTLPVGLTDGKTLRIAQRGLPNWSGGKPGNLIVTIRHEWPVKLSKTTLELLSQLSNQAEFHSREDEHGFQIRPGINTSTNGS